MSHRPWVNYGLLAANILLFFFGYNGSTPMGHLRIDQWLLYPNNPEIHQFFSSMFLHGSFMHLAGNMIFLWVFGNAINDRFGHVGYLLFYLGGGVLAGVGYVLMAGNAPVLGASGAISAVTGAFLVLLPRARITLVGLLLYVIVPFEVSSLYFLLIQFIWNLVMSYSQLGGLGGGNVAYWAHSSGYVYGIGLSIMLLAIGILPRDSFDMLSLIRSGHRRRKFRRMVSQGYSPFDRSAPPSAPHSWQPPKPVSADNPSTPDEKEMYLRAAITRELEKHDLDAAARAYLQLVQIADEAVLPVQQQLDVANQLMATQRYPQAANAYEQFINHYSHYEHLADIQLMLGLVYGRYLHQYDRARDCLSQALERLQDPRKVELARGDLAAIEANQP
ncbi:MAG: rhomboid family intramembrane serine protease [Planctomycetes bacterium]|nr:rhomboid family intramembrane serine protease [Planctomycetota bacterium]